MLHEFVDDAGQLSLLLLRRDEERQFDRFGSAKTKDGAIRTELITMGGLSRTRTDIPVHLHRSAPFSPDALFANHFPISEESGKSSLNSFVQTMGTRSKNNLVLKERASIAINMQEGGSLQGYISLKISLLQFHNADLLPLCSPATLYHSHAQPDFAPTYRGARHFLLGICGRRQCSLGQGAYPPEGHPWAEYC